MDANEYLKKHGLLDDEKEEQEEDTLDNQAYQRAKELDDLNAGTPFDWEDLERYKNKG